MKPTTILFQTTATTISKRRKAVFFYCDNGATYSKSELENVSGIKYACIRKRILYFGFESPKILHVGPLEKESIAKYGKPLGRIPKKNQWNRTKCKRDSVLCKNYHSCADKRLGISKEKWIAPKDTNKCYRAVVLPLYGVYPSALNCPSTFGMLGE